MPKKKLLFFLKIRDLLVYGTYGVYADHVKFFVRLQFPFRSRLDHRRSETSGSGGGSSVVLPSLAASHRQHPLPSAHTAINATAHKTISPSSESVAFNTPSQSQELLLQSSPPHSSPDPSSIASIHQPSPLLALPPTVEHLLLFSIDY